MSQEKRYRYRGVEPFRKIDEDIFQGRDDAKEQLFTRIMLSKTLVMHGESGLGKSSLIQAGIVPKLEREQPDYLAVVISLDFSSVLAEEEGEIIATPATLLDVILEKIRKEAELPAEPFFPFLGEPADGLWLVAKKIAFKNKKLLLFFDQFEELQTFSKDEVAAFKRELSELLNSQIPPAIYKAIRKYKDKTIEKATTLSAEERAEFNRNIQFLESPLEGKAVFALREDKLGTMTLLADVFPDILKNDFVLNPLTKDEAFTAISEPARVAGNFKSKNFAFESDDLVRTKVTEIGGEDTSVDPIQLQLVCRNIEESLVIKKRRSRITADEFPSVKDTIFGFYWRNWEAVQTFLDKTKSGTDYNAKRQAVISQLVVNGRRNMVHSDLLISNAEIQAKEDKGVIGILCSRGLIREIPAGKDKYYQLCHDRFMEPLLDDRKTLLDNGELLNRIAANDKVARVQSEKIRKLWFIAVVLGLAVVGIVGAVIFYARSAKLNNAVQNEFLGAVKGLRKDNPTLAYEELREFQASMGGGSNPELKRYLDRFDSVNDAYLLYTFPINSTMIQASIAGDRNSITLADRSSITTWDIRKGMITGSAKLRKGSYERSVIVNKTQYWLVSHDDGSIELEDEAGDTHPLLAHTNGGKIIDISGDGKYVLVGNVVYDGTTKKPIGPLPVIGGITNNIVVAQFLHDNKHIVAGDYSGYKAIFELGPKPRTVALMTPFSNDRHTKSVITSLAVDSKDRFLVAGNRDNNVEVWRIDDLDNVDQRSLILNSLPSLLTGHTGEINTVSVAPNDSMIVSGSKDHTAIVWDLYAHNKLAILKGMTEEVTFAKFFHDCRSMITATKNGLAYVWTYGKADSIYKVHGGLARFTPFDYYNTELEDRTDVFRKHYDTTGIDNLFSRTLQYISNLPVANSRPTEEDYRANLQYSIREVDSMYQSLRNNPAFVTMISPANKIILYQVYAELWKNRGDLLYPDEAEPRKEYLERMGRFGLILKEKVLVDSADAAAAASAASILYYVGRLFNESNEYGKSIYYLSEAVSLIESTGAVRSFGPSQAIYTELGNAYLYENNPDSAMVVARKMDRLGYWGATNVLYTEAYLLKDDLPQARATVQQTIKRMKNFKEVFIQELADALGELRDHVHSPVLQQFFSTLNTN